MADRAFGEHIREAFAMVKDWRASKMQPSPKGWECPRCGAIHAPHVDHCSCQPSLIPMGPPYAPYYPPAFPYPPIVDTGGTHPIDWGPNVKVYYAS